MSDTPKGCAVIQRDINRLEKWASRNLRKYNKDKSEVLHWGRNSPRHQLGATQKTAWQESIWGLNLVDTKLLQRRLTVIEAALGKVLPACEGR